MRGRKGAGTIFMVGFVVAVLIMTLVAYISPSDIRVEEDVHEDFIDTLAYMTNVVNTASSLPGGTDVQAAFIERHFKHLSEEMMSKQIMLVYRNITVPLAGGNGYTVIVIYTLSRGDTYFTGMLGTNLTDLEYRIGKASGGSVPPPSPTNGSGDVATFRHSSNKWAIARGWKILIIGEHPKGSRIIFRALILNFQNYGYDITIDFDTNGEIMWGQYICLEPFQIKRIFGPFSSPTVTIGGTPGLTGTGGIAYYEKPKSSYDEDEVSIDPQGVSFSGDTVTIYYTDDPYQAFRISHEGYVAGVEYFDLWQDLGGDLFGIDHQSLLAEA